MFNDWILSQLQERDWSQADLARASGLTTAAISKYIGGRIPEETALRKIAKALKLSPEAVFRAAGILPPTVEDPWVAAQTARLEQLTDPTLRQLAERFILSVVEQEEAVKKAAQFKPKPVEK